MFKNPVEQDISDIFLLGWKWGKNSYHDRQLGKMAHKSIEHNFSTLEDMTNCDHTTTEIFPNCGRLKCGILLNFWKLYNGILWMTTFLDDDCRNTSTDVSETFISAWPLLISHIIWHRNLSFSKFSVLRVSHFCGNF